jgi:hypothetical protein
LGQPTPAPAQLRLGEEFRVNSYTTGSQGSAHVASHSGGFVVVWAGPDQDPGSAGVFGQRYDASGGPVGSEFQVNTYTTGPQWGARVATDEDGDFVVVWLSEGQGDSIFGQLFDAEGSPTGGEFFVGMGEDNLSVRDVGMDAEGNFVVVWDRGNFWAWGLVLARRFDASGNPLGSEFLVSEATTWDVHHQPAIAVADGGDFVVTWTSAYGSPTYCCREVLGRRYDASGSALGDAFVVTWEDMYQGQSDVAMDRHGEFVVVWASFAVCPFDDEDCTPSSPNAAFGIVGQRFDSEGNKVGLGFTVKATTTNYTRWPGVGARGDDEFVVVWHEDYGAGYDVRGRIVNDLGVGLGSEFLVNSYTTGEQGGATVAAGPNGDFLVVWHGPGVSYDVFGQRFAGPGLALTVDGSCPGPVTVDVSSAPPNSEVAVIAAANTNGFTKGGALCNGTHFEIGEPFQLPPRFVIVDGGGNGSTNLTLGANRCHVQALAFATCETSNVVAVP